MLINPGLFLRSVEEMPSQLFPWVTHPSSLTKKLKQEGRTHLEILNQQWVRAGWWDKYALKIENQMVMRREIVMRARGEHCWYARTLIPYSSYQRDKFFFDRLKSESLDKLIFGNNRIDRVVLFHYSITRNCLEYYWLKELIPETYSKLWVRLSVFELDKNNPFYLVEIMLPGLERIIN